MTQQRLGLLLASAPPERLAAAARRAEQIGFDEVWVPEDYFESSGPVAAAVALAATDQIPVGIGVASVATRQPALLAMDAATIAGAFPGRLRLGVGAGMSFSLDAMGVKPRSALGLVRSAVDVVRDLLGGGTCGDVGLAHPPTVVPPVFAGGLGPKMLELAGEVADGVVISSLSSPAYLGWAAGRVAEGAARAGRPRPPLTCFAWAAVDADGQAARERMRGIIAGVLGALGPLPLTDVDGYSRPLADLIERGGAEAVAAEMPIEWSDAMTVAGDAHVALAAIRARLAAGADAVILSPMPAETFEDQLGLISREIVPHIGI
jgi:alkanesulfonate monooxygenase SsuD/methylene tetrahydromethanopterin reductase-like flavin-dependent oxidoreductase (luciferase family)